IGVARSANPSGPFTDLGKVLDTQSSGVSNSIDQFYMTTGSGRNKKTYLFWGSYRGIYGQEIAADMKSLTGTKFKIAGNGFEGTYIYEQIDKETGKSVFWYFGSNNNCCDGKDSQYQLSIARATSVTGPYRTKDGVDIINDGVKGTLFLHGDQKVGFVGPGHNAEIIVDDNGRSFILYHAVRYDNPLLYGGATRRPLMMDEVLWGADGWPYIEGGVPSNTPKIAPHFNSN
ncbi:MAG: family 43 glycosylhydrolase, partial [Paludibacter sp.]|nr:family 43 glycosylhydrolase [Paludibacter sp.]